MGRAFGSEPTIVVQAVLDRLEEDVTFAIDAPIDVVLVDSRTIRSPSVRVLESLRQRHPSCRIVAMVTESGPKAIERCATVTLAGILPQDTSLEDLIAGVHKVHSGEFVFPPQMAFELLMVRARGHPHDGTGIPQRKVTRKEQEVLRLMAQGRTNKAIVRDLGMALSTVKTHVHNILMKLGAETRSEAVAIARGMDLLADDVDPTRLPAAAAVEEPAHE